MKKILALVLSAAMAISMLAGCTTAKDTAAPAAEAKAEDAKTEDAGEATAAKEDDGEIVIGVLFDSLTVESRVKQRDAIIAHAEELGVKVVFQDAGLNEKTQMEQAENLLSQGVDAICILAHNADAMKPLSQMCKDDGVILLATDRLIEGVSIDYFVGLDNDTVGYQQADFAIKEAPKGNYILLAGAATDPNAIAWKEIWNQELKPLVDAGDINIVFEEFCENWDPTLAATYTENALTTCNDELAAVLCMNDGMGTGVVQALKQRGLDGKVVMTGLDGEAEAYKRIAEGTQSMTLQIDDEAIATMIVDILVDVCKGGDASAYLNGTINNGYADIPAATIPYIEVNKDNLMEMIDRGFANYDATFADVPEDQRPAKN